MQNALFLTRVKKTWLKRSHTSSDKLEIQLDSSNGYALLPTTEVMCGQGKLNLVSQLITDQPDRIHLRDSKGSTCMHHAAMRGQTAVIDLLQELNADIDAQDNEGCTPLHRAAEKGQVEAIRHLLLRNAQGNLQNHKKHAPVHMAVIADKPASIQVLSTFPDKVDMNLRAERGETALHLACQLDYDECAKALVALKINGGVAVNQCCDNGFYPIHIAAKSASCKTLMLMLNCKGVTDIRSVLEWHIVVAVVIDDQVQCTAKLLQLRDREGNQPLHSAVNSGDFNAVKICLDHGARVAEIQSENSTAFHLACSQGTVGVVKLMLAKHFADHGQKAKEILAALDVMQMTPLHRAAMYDHPEVVTFLIEQGTDIDATDIERRTPAMLAAHRGGCRSLKILLDSGAKIGLFDTQKRNVLHYIVASYYDAHLLQALDLICQREDGPKLLNQKDLSGCTPLHLASKQGNLTFLETLLKLGAAINLKDNEEQGPLHFAARFGRVNSVQRLIFSPMGPNIINETDSAGMTALHVASLNGHSRVVRLLLFKGALLHRDFQGRSPLHLAASGGSIETMKLLLAVHHNLLDMKCKSGNTALHMATASNQPAAVEYLLSAGCSYSRNNEYFAPLEIAINSRHIDVAMTMIQHERWQEVLKYRSNQYICPLLGLIQHMPEVYQSILDRSITQHKGDDKDCECWVQYNFRLMEHMPSVLRQDRKSEPRLQPLLALNEMVRFGRVELLSHPACLQYLQAKWHTYGCTVYVFNMFVYLMFVAALTMLILKLNPLLHLIEHVNGTYYTDVYYASPGSSEKTTIVHLLFTFLIGFLLCNILKEILQMCQQGFQYFLDYTNFVEWSLYLSTGAFVFPAFLTGQFTHLQWQCAIAAIFLTWFNLLIYLQKLDKVGIYVVMFLHILRTMVKVILVFSVLFIAFGLTFFILHNENEDNFGTGTPVASSRRIGTMNMLGFNSPFIAIMHTVTLMMGDWDFVRFIVYPYFDDDDATLHYPTQSFFFLVLFIICMPILFINLLIGLAVGDIELVQKDAQLKRLAMQVEYHTSLEERFPQWILARIDCPELKVYPNKFNCTKAIWSKLLAALKSVPFIVHSFDATTSHRSMRGSSGQLCTDAMYDMIFTEIGKTRRRLNDAVKNQEKQLQLLRMVLQKMEIKSEGDYFDDGPSTDESDGQDADSLSARLTRYKTKKFLP